jgi:hypothetical protein
MIFPEQRFAPALVDGIDFRSRDVEYKFRRTQQEFMGEFTYAGSPLRIVDSQPDAYLYYRKIRKFASEPNETSYIFSEMTPAYRSAASQSGKPRIISPIRIPLATLDLPFNC